MHRNLRRFPHRTQRRHEAVLETGCTVENKIELRTRRDAVNGLELDRALDGAASHENPRAGGIQLSGVGDGVEDGLSARRVEIGG